MSCRRAEKRLDLRDERFGPFERACLFAFSGIAHESGERLGRSPGKDEKSGQFRKVQFPGAAWWSVQEAAVAVA